MTILQIRAVLLTAELGSISAAAKELNVSQPNASNGIKLLEEEVGFPIFYRTRTGAVLTRKGELFLTHARQILEQNEKISELRNADEVYRLRLGGVNYYTCIEPFLTLCQEHRDDPETDFRYFSVSVEDGIENLVKRNLDIVVVPILKHQLAGLINECEKNGIAMTSVCEIPTVLLVRQGHPAALDGSCCSITQGSDAMKAYPYVVYRNLFEDSGATGYNDSDFVQCRYKIYVDEIDVRLRMIANTNAFAFGARSSSTIMNRYGLLAFPVPGITLEMFVLTRPDDAQRREIRDYMALLHEELKTVL